MKHRIAMLFVVVFLCLAQWAHSSVIEKSEIPQDIYQEALNFYENIQKNSAEVTYSNFDEMLKKEVELEQVKDLTAKLKDFINGAYSIDLKKAEFHETERGVYTLLFQVETDKAKIEYIVSLKKNDKGIFIRGFNFKSLPVSQPNTSFSFKNAKSTHYIVFISFILCIIAQIWCLVFFIRKKKLKRKWLYIILSFIGFPCGIGIQWATGAFSLSFGFKIPAVSISMPLHAPGMWTMFVFFPIGIIAMLMVRSKDIDQYIPVNPQADVDAERP